MCTDEVTTPESQAEAYTTSEEEPLTDESGTTTYIRSGEGVLKLGLGVHGCEFIGMEEYYAKKLNFVLLVYTLWYILKQRGSGGAPQKIVTILFIFNFGTEEHSLCNLTCY